MKLAFYKGPHAGFAGLFDRAVRWWTRGPYSHVELVLSDGVCWSSSARDGGVRSKVIDLDPAKWDLVEVDGNELAARWWFEIHRGKKYDYLGLFGFVWRTVRSPNSRWFCSEAVAASLGFTQSWRFDPNTLAVVFGRIER